MKSLLGFKKLMTIFGYAGNGEITGVESVLKQFLLSAYPITLVVHLDGRGIRSVCLTI